MSISDDDFEKLIGLVDANRAGLERLRTELEHLKRDLESQGLRTGLRRTGRLAEDQRPAPPPTSGDSEVL
jgi:hypothetical protein